MVGQNAILTSSNMFEWLSQESVSLNPFAWHSNYYLTIRMACAQCQKDKRTHKQEKFELYHLKGIVKTAT